MLQQRIILLLFVALTFVGCNSPDPHPELKDSIYQDMAQQKDQTSKDLEAAIKKLEGHKAELKKVVPQTGQIKFIEKRIWETQTLIDSFKQQQKYWVIRLDQRRDYVRRKSLEAFNEGKPWSDPKEFEAYQTEKRLRLAKLDWDTKSRREHFLRENGLASQGNGKKEEKKAASGGH